ncbi:MAG: hypothetical protein WC881_00860 [Elusimicrobiota bacterium]|jgi:hypothetical protein
MQLSVLKSKPILIFCWALLLRVLMCVVVAAVSGIAWRNLALFFDGHIYILIAKTLPKLYGDVYTIFPAFPKSANYLTGWFPLYPAVMFLADSILKDMRLSALLCAMVLSSLSVVLFYRLAKKEIDCPGAAAVLFSFFPPTWLLSGSLAFVEPLYVGLFILAMYLFLQDNSVGSIILASLVIITQKSGFLIILIMFIINCIRDGNKNIVRSWPLLLSFIPALIMQGYLGWLFHDPLVNINTHKAVFGGTYFAFPAQFFLRDLFLSGSPFQGLFWLRKITIVGALCFYAGTFVWSWPRRNAATMPYLVWLGVVLTFTLCLSGDSAFYAFPRFMAVAAPAAIMLLAKNFPWLFSRPGLILTAVPVIVVFNGVEAISQIDLASRYWGPEYFRALVYFLGR